MDQKAENRKYAPLVTVLVNNNEIHRMNTLIGIAERYGQHQLLDYFITDGRYRQRKNPAWAMVIGLIERYVNNKIRDARDKGRREAERLGQSPEWQEKSASAY